MPDPPDMLTTTPAVLAAYWVLGSAAWAGLTLLAWRLVTREREGRVATAQRLRQNQPEPFIDRRRYAMKWLGSAALVLAVAMLLRAVPVATLEPVLSDDFWRYQLDGDTFRQGVSPYLSKPGQLIAIAGTSAEVDVSMGLSDQTKAVLPRINHPELHTIYQPASQWVFAGAMTMHRWLARDAWAPHRTFRGVFSGIDLLVIAVLLVVLWQQRRSAWWAALYAWHPLAITETAWSGHQDVIGILAVVAMLACFDQVRGQDPPATEYPGDEQSTLAMGWWSAAAGLLLATAIAVKPVVAPLALPLTAIAWRRRWGMGVWLAGVVATLAALLAWYLPFVMYYGGLHNMAATARVFADKWAFNSLSHALLLPLGLEPAQATALAMAVVGTVVIVTAAVVRDVWRATMTVVFAGLLLSSTVYPWYLLWVLALLPIRFSRGVWAMSAVLPVSYEVLLHPSQWRLPRWIIVMEYTAAGVGLAWDAAAAWWERRLTR